MEYVCQMKELSITCIMLYIRYHWVLFVIDLSSMIVYYLDSFYHGEINTSLRIVINIGVQIYGITKRMNRKPIWQVVE